MTSLLHPANEDALIAACLWIAAAGCWVGVLA
jgi:hypothetical protein